MNLSEAFAHLDSPGVVGAICVLLGGVLNQILVNKSKIEENKHKLQEREQVDSVAVRQELMSQFKEALERCERLEASNSEWQRKYYIETSELKTKVGIMEAQIQAMSSKLAEISSRPPSVMP